MEKIIIPVFKLSKNAIYPVFNGNLSNNNKFIYNLHTSEAGNDIKRDVNSIKTDLQILIPTGVKCQKKSIHFMENNNIVQNYSYDSGLSELPNNVPIILDFDIYNDPLFAKIKCNQIIGGLVFERKVEFVKTHMNWSKSKNF